MKVLQIGPDATGTNSNGDSLDNIGGFSSTTHYWSSSQWASSPSGWAWTMSFTATSGPGNSPKGSNLNVRAVRYF